MSKIFDLILPRKKHKLQATPQVQACASRNFLCAEKKQWKLNVRHWRNDVLHFRQNTYLPDLPSQRKKTYRNYRKLTSKAHIKTYALRSCLPSPSQKYIAGQQYTKPEPTHYMVQQTKSTLIKMSFICADLRPYNVHVKIHVQRIFFVGEKGKIMSHAWQKRWWQVGNLMGMALCGGGGSSSGIKQRICDLVEGTHVSPRVSSKIKKKKSRYSHSQNIVSQEEHFLLRGNDRLRSVFLLYTGLANSENRTYYYFS